MDYEILKLSDELYFIRWLHSPEEGAPSERHFIEDLKTRLDEADKPIYFISDLRLGRINNIKVLRELGKLSQHKHWGGSTAFSSDPLTSVVVGVFSRFAGNEHPEDEIWKIPEEAIAYLESLKPGITTGIDWQTVLQNESS